MRRLLHLMRAGPLLLAVLAPSPTEAAAAQYAIPRPFHVALYIPDDEVEFSDLFTLRVLLIGGMGGNRVSAMPTHTRDIHFIVRDRRGRIVEPATPPMPSPPNAPEKPDGSNMLRLSGGRIYGQDVDVLGRQLVPGPGKYTVTLRYHSEVSPELDSIPGAITRADGPFFSEPVELTVRR